MKHKIWIGFAMTLFTACAPLLPVSDASAAPADGLERRFVSPPDSVRPWVYWYFMDGNITREGIRADLEAMKKAGIGGAIFLEVGIGVPRGPVAHMSPQWQQLYGYAVSEAKRSGWGCKSRWERGQDGREAAGRGSSRNCRCSTWWPAKPP